MSSGPIGYLANGRIICLGAGRNTNVFLCESRVGYALGPRKPQTWLRHDRNRNMFGTYHRPRMRQVQRQYPKVCVGSHLLVDKVRREQYRRPHCKLHLRDVWRRWGGLIGLAATAGDAWMKQARIARCLAIAENAIGTADAPAESSRPAPFTRPTALTRATRCGNPHFAIDRHSAAIANPSDARAFHSHASTCPFRFSPRIALIGSDHHGRNPE